jgi:hypothetical protein
MDLLTLLRTQWDRAAAWVSIAIGALAMIIGWVGVSGTGLTAEQIPYVISGGLGGIFLLGLGAMLWLSADMRDEWRLLEELRRALEGDDAAPASAQAPSDPEATRTLRVPAPADREVASVGSNGARRQLRAQR